ncbi:hypothetical protein WN944_027333 [Citrus x changshan-huyou]|uniref:PSII 6.1 kDa protein n=1 Tax=Citrus x changshan-huyou TaxID=2935761 RepID=A0AAP0LHC7_9ROSI
MASISSTNFPALLPRSGFVPKGLTHASPVYGLPAMATTRGRVRCSLEEKAPAAASSKSSKANMVASLMAAAAALSTAAGPAMALVDERMTTEGTGLPFGLSNNTLGWILFGVFGLIWALYFIYTGDLEEDEESGLSL